MTDYDHNKIEGRDIPKNPESLEIPSTLKSSETYREQVLQEVSSKAEEVKNSSEARIDRVENIGLSHETIEGARKESGFDEKLGQNSSDIDRLQQETEENIKSVQIGNTKDLPQMESAENTQERKSEYIKGSFQEIRGNILKNALTWETVSNSANLIPFAGSGKMMIEAIAGKEAHGKALSGKDRIIHGAIGVGSLALDFTGLGEIEKGAIVVGRSVGLVEKIGAKLAEKGAVKSARIFERTAKFMVEHPELTKKGEEYAEQRVRGALKDMKNYKRGERVEQNPDLAMAA